MYLSNVFLPKKLALGKIREIRKEFKRGYFVSPLCSKVLDILLATAKKTTIICNFSWTKNSIEEAGYRFHYPAKNFASSSKLVHSVEKICELRDSRKVYNFWPSYCSLLCLAFCPFFSILKALGHAFDFQTVFKRLIDSRRLLLSIHYFVKKPRLKITSMTKLTSSKYETLSAGQQCGPMI